MSATPVLTPDEVNTIALFASSKWNAVALANYVIELKLSERRDERLADVTAGMQADRRLV